MTWHGRLRRVRCERAWRRLLAAGLPSHPPRLEAALRAFLEAGLPPATRAAANLPALALDLETTGLDPRQHRIVSVGWVALEADIHLATARHHMLREAQGGGEAVHGILHDARSEGESLEQVLSAFFEAARGRVLVAHHLPMETGFLEAAIQATWGIELPLVGVDTLALERRIERGAPGHGTREDTPGAFRLPAVRARYGLPAYPLHDALSDAMAAGELFMAQRARLLARHGRLTLGDLS